MSAVAEYDAQRGRYAFLWDSYWGGAQYRSPSSTTIGTATLSRYVQVEDDHGPTGAYRLERGARVSTYLVPHAGEEPVDFETRAAVACYVNLCQPIVDAYVDAVMGPVSRDLGSIAPYVASLNGRGQDWGGLADETARWAATYGWCATVLQPPRSNPARNLAEEEALGVSLRATLVHPTAIAWIAVDDDGAVEEFAYASTPYDARATGPSHTLVRLHVHKRDAWEVHQVLVKVGSGLGTVRPHLSAETRTLTGKSATPGYVPVTFAFFREVTASPTPLGVSLIDDAADLCRGIYNKLSEVDIIHRVTPPFLAIPEAAAGGTLPPDTAIKVGPQQALGFNSQTGAPQYVQPSAESPRELREHAVFLGAMALRTTGLEVSGGDSPANASGEALKVRSRDFSARCVRFAKAMMRWEAETMALAARILSKPAPPAPTYPKSFSLPDAAQDLSRALLALQGVDGLGPMARQALARQVLDAALSLSDEQLSAMVAEMRDEPPAPPPPPPAHPSPVAEDDDTDPTEDDD